MAVEDLNTLRQQLPEVFEDMTVPDSWDDEWIIVPVEEPESALYEPTRLHRASRIFSPGHRLRRRHCFRRCRPKLLSETA
jgi:hypothetical protein